MNRYCELCLRGKRVRSASRHIKMLFGSGGLYGLIEYLAPIWERWDLCTDCLHDLVMMLIAIQDTLKGVDTAITVEDFKRHADSLHGRAGTYFDLLKKRGEHNG